MEDKTAEIHTLLGGFAHVFGSFQTTDLYQHDGSFLSGTELRNGTFTPGTAQSVPRLYEFRL